MKKSELKQIIKECLLNEYDQKELIAIIKPIHKVYNQLEAIEKDNKTNDDFIGLHGNYVAGALKDDEQDEMIEYMDHLKSYMKSLENRIKLSRTLYALVKQAFGNNI
jgi:hypothetical protein